MTHSIPYNDIGLSLLENSSEGLLILNEHLSVCYSNPSARKMLKYEAQQLDGISAQQLIAGDSGEAFALLCNKIIRQKQEKTGSAAITLLSRNGMPVFTQLHLHNHIRSSEGSLLLVLFSDVSAERQSEDHFLKIFHSSPLPKVITDIETGVYIDVNESMSKLVGFRREEMIGKTAVSLGMVVDNREQILAELKEHGNIHHREITLRTKNNQLFYLLLYAETIEIAGRKCYLGSHVDITGQKKSQEKIIGLSDLLQNILENTSDAFIALSNDWEIFYINEKASVYTGKSKEELLGKNVLALYPYLAGSEFEAKVHRVMEEQIAVSYEHLRTAGTPAWFNIHISPIKEGVAVFFSDITEKKHAEQAMLRMNENLERKVKERTLELTHLLEREKTINEMKSRFVSMASHEFRTPLSTLLTSLSLLEKYVRPASGSPERKHVNRIKSSVDQLTDILNNFLSLDKLENGKLDVKDSVFNLKLFAEELVSDVSGLLKPGQEIRFHYSGAEQVTQDKLIIKSIIYNLISNAIKFSPENKPVTLSIDVRENRVNLSVKDEGIGIPPHEQQYIFSRLFRAGNVTNISGTGLGLNIVKRYVELLGGEISFSSKMHEETEFRVSLPFLQNVQHKLQAGE